MKYLVYGVYQVTHPRLKQLALRYSKALELLSNLPLKKEYKLVEAKPADFDIYQLVHTSEYVELLKRVECGEYLANDILPETIAFEKIGVGGTLTATFLALSEKCLAYHLGGGYHHGLPDRPNRSDYCNDVAIALKFILSTGIERVLYIDLDAHHPDGVQKIFEEEPRILQVSLHAWLEHTNEGHYSFIGKGAGRGKKINMPLPPHTGDRIYLQILKAILVSVMKKYQPEVVFYQAGVDPYRNDPIGCLNLSLRGLYERDRLVASICANKPIPFVVVLGGGYDLKNTPRAIINSLAALAGRDIVFDEPESLGAPSGKALRWYNSLRACLSLYLELEEITNQ